MQVLEDATFHLESYYMYRTVPIYTTLSTFPLKMHNPKMGMLASEAHIYLFSSLVNRKVVRIT